MLTDDQLGALLDACAGKAFTARRDTGIIRTLLDTGGRLSEVARLKVDDVDFNLDVLYVLGKGRRGRSVPFGRRTGLALNRYLRARRRHDKSAHFMSPTVPEARRKLLAPRLAAHRPPSGTAVWAGSTLDVSSGASAGAVRPIGDVTVAHTFDDVYDLPRLMPAALLHRIFDGSSATPSGMGRVLSTSSGCDGLSFVSPKCGVSPSVKHWYC